MVVLLEHVKGLDFDKKLIKFIFSHQNNSFQHALLNTVFPEMKNRNGFEQKFQTRPQKSMRF